MLPILYSFRRCPYAMRARLALLANGLSVELREVTLRVKPTEMLAASPKATVPVMILPDGRVIEESIDILRWAYAERSESHPVDAQVEALIATNDGIFKHHLDRYKYADRYPVDQTDHRAAASAILASMDTWFAAQTEATAELPTVIDIAILPFVRQFAETDRAYFDQLPLAALQHRLATLLDSRLFAGAMVRLPPWKPGDGPIVFPADQ